MLKNWFELVQKESVSATETRLAPCESDDRLHATGFSFSYTFEHTEDTWRKLMARPGKGSRKPANVKVSRPYRGGIVETPLGQICQCGCLLLGTRADC